MHTFYHRVSSLFLLFFSLLAFSLVFPSHSHAAGTTLSFTVFLHGIGKGGDSANATSGGNANPRRTQRILSVGVFNAQNVLVQSKAVPVTFNSGAGNFTGSADFGSLGTGVYTITIRADQFLQKAAPGIQQITTSTTNQVSPVYLLTGDIDNNNQVNITDYNLLMGCYSDLTPAKSCTATQKTAADLTDDGSVNQLDYNLFIREIGNRSGETNPTAIPLTQTSSPAPTISISSGPITNRPAQPAALMYGGTESLGAAYKHPGAMVAAGRDNYQNQVFKDISASGGSVLIYLDVIIDASYGRYHTMLLSASECGPAVPRWPGNPKANEWGNLNDFRVGGVLQGKLECVLEKMVAENPHMAGWFADDIGSRSWYPGFSWDSWSTTDKQAYRDGAIALTKTFRKVADKHGLIFIVNGTWSGGALASNGGGYPDMNQSGNALADGGFVEHHDGEVAYFTPYACSAQWAAQSPITKGKAFMWEVSTSDADRNAYTASNCFSYTANQSDYGKTPTPWGAFHATGLPSKVAR